jgi:hypothetical protein
MNSDNLLECSVHTLPKPLLREFSHVFGEKHLQHRDESMDLEEDQMEILAIPTNQQAREDLVGVGENIEQEKDRLLNVVRDRRCLRLPFGNRCCELLE